MPIYRCRTTGSALAFSKEKGTPSIALAFASLFDTSAPEEPLTADLPPKFYTNLWLTDKTIDRTIETLRQTFGWKGEDFTELNDAGPLDGIEVDIVWEWESYQDAGGQDKWRARVDWINRPGTGGVKKADAQDAARIAAQFNRLLKPAPRAGAAAVPRAGVPGQPVAQRAPAGAAAPSAPGSRSGAAAASRPVAPARQAPPDLQMSNVAPDLEDGLPY